MGKAGCVMGTLPTGADKSKGAVPAYRDLLDLSRVGDDLLHHLHGLSSATLGLLCLTLRLGLYNLHLLTFSDLHCHRCGLEGRVKRELFEFWLRACRSELGAHTLH